MTHEDWIRIPVEGVNPNTLPSRRFVRKPLAAAALLAFLALECAHALPAADGLASTIGGGFPDPIDPTTQYDRTYDGTNTSLLTSRLPIDGSGSGIDKSLVAFDIPSTGNSAKKLKLTSMDGIEGLIFTSYSGNKTPAADASGNLLHIELGNVAGHPFAFNGLDIQDLSTLSSASAVAIQQGSAIDNQLWIRNSAITLQTQGQPRMGWSASAANIENPTGDATGNVVVIDNSNILYDEGTDQFSNTRIRLGAASLKVVNNPSGGTNVSNNALWVRGSQLDANALYAAYIYSNWTRVAAADNSVYIAGSTLRLNPYKDGNGQEGIFAVRAASQADGNWVEITDSDLTVVASQKGDAQYIEAVQAVESAEGNTTIVRDSNITSAATIYFSGASANLASDSVRASSNSVFIGSTNQDARMSINYIEDKIGTYIHGGRVYSTDAATAVDASGNTVSIANLNVNSTTVIRSGYIWGTGANGTISDNSVSIANSTFDGRVLLHGGAAASGSGNSAANGNSLNVSNARFRDVEFVGGFVQTGEASGNIVAVEDAAFEGAPGGAVVLAGGRVSGAGAANSNTVEISRTKLADGAKVFGGFASEASGNSVVIGESVTSLDGGRWSAASVLGWSGMLASGGNTFTTSSPLDAVRFGGFQHYNFILGSSSFSDGAVVNVTGTEPVFLEPDGADHSTVAIGGVDLALAAGSYALITSAAGFVNNDGIALTGGTLAENVKGELTLRSVKSVVRIAASTLNKDSYDLSIVDGADGAQSLVLDVKSPIAPPAAPDSEVNEETDALMESSLSTMTTHFAADDLFVDAVLRSRDGRRDGLFAAARGGRWSFDSRTRIESSIVSGLVGFGAHASENLTMGAFVEMGHGSYDTRTHVSGVEKKGDGSHNYGGLGIFGDYAVPAAEGLHLTGYLKVGLMRNEFTTSLFGAGVDYDRTGLYWGAHLGAHYDWNLSEAIRSRIFLSYFYDGQGKESFGLSGQDGIEGASAEYDAIHAHRVQVGSMLEFAVGKTWRPYLGLTLEQTISARAKGTAVDSMGSIELNSSDLQGSTGIASAGWTYASGGFSTEMGLSGYAGTRNGISGQIQANWKF